MSRIKISLAALAFVLATGAAFANKAGIADGWYRPDFMGDTNGLPESSVPDCNGETDLCATHYTNQIPDQVALKD